MDVEIIGSNPSGHWNTGMNCVCQFYLFIYFQIIECAIHTDFYLCSYNATNETWRDSLVFMSVVNIENITQQKWSVLSSSRLNNAALLTLFIFHIMHKLIQLIIRGRYVFVEQFALEVQHSYAHLYSIYFDYYETNDCT